MVAQQVAHESDSSPCGPKEAKFPRLSRDFYYKGWRDENDAADDANAEDHLQLVLQASGSGGSGLRVVLQKLLESGGDERSVTNPRTGLTKYHTPTCPSKGVHRSSCTSNVATEEAFRRGVDTLRQLVLEARNMSKQSKCNVIYSSPEALFKKLLCDVRERLRALFELSVKDAISLFPSGTDAEFMPALYGFAKAHAQNERGTALFTVVVAAGEVGSGTSLAATGKHFAKVLPSGRSSAQDYSCMFTNPFDGHEEITGVDLYMRRSTGEMLGDDERDKLVEGVVEKAAAETDSNGKPKYGCIVVHMVVGSKTGQCMPSETCMDRIVKTYGSLILPVVDACQGRFHEGTIRKYLDKGRVVLCTGSKFFGGPPFSGVCFMSGSTAGEMEKFLMDDNLQQMLLKCALKEYISAPLMSDDLPQLRSLLPLRHGPLNYGCLLRWTLALHEMEAYFAEVPQAERVRLLRAWTRGVCKVIEEKKSPLVKLFCDDERTQGFDEADEQHAALSTIVTFVCRCNRGTPEAGADTMTMEELRHVQFLMATDLSQQYPHLSLLGSAKACFYIGQPVHLGPDPTSTGLNVLRVAASAPLIVRTFHEGIDVVLREDELLVDKLVLILGNWFLFKQHQTSQ
eukprot:TRINITY_DN1883_c0_g2_i1.p1 TRINITY_DN1883_c0_g2~~TRINITY_DN1883_c0_g2_i1.p1  ORF type:complete len:649 (-),score=115.47 TRINITY_DN1883_c0_g2_i1:105-1982(-)